MTLPAIPMPDDLVDRIAKEIAATVADHIETMYPAAAKAVAWNSCKLSIQGVVRNGVASAGRAAENGCADEWIDISKRRRAANKPAWKFRACYHARRGDLFFQVNVPISANIHEFEVVVFKHGSVIDRATFWDSTESHRDGINIMEDAHTKGRDGVMHMNDLHNYHLGRSMISDDLYTNFDGRWED